MLKEVFRQGTHTKRETKTDRGREERERDRVRETDRDREIGMTESKGYITTS